MLKIEVITREADLRPIVGEWERLDETLSPRTPFTSPLWCLNWLKHFRRSSLRASDHLRVYLVRDEGGALLCVAPMLVTHRPGFGPIKARELQFFGADPYVTELRGPCCRREDLGRVMDALAAHVDAEGCCDWVQWRGLPPGHDFRHIGLDFMPDPQLESIDHFLQMRPTWDEFRATLPRNIKESLRKCYNSLARDGVEFTVRVVSREDEAEAALLRFFDLHRSRAEKSGTIEHPNAFESAHSQAFLVDYAREMARRDCLRVFQLIVEDQIVATRVGFLHGTELYLYFSGYDPEMGRYSIMTTTVAEAFKWAIGNGISVVNLSSGTDVSKTRWRPENVQAGGGYMQSASGSRIAFNIVRRLRQPREKALQAVA